MKDYLEEHAGELVLLIFLLVLTNVMYALGYWKASQDQQRPIVHVVDNAGALMVGKVTDKEIIDGKHTVTVGAYGKFLVTEEQYNEITVGDDIPDYLKGRGN